MQAATPAGVAALIEVAELQAAGRDTVTFPTITFPVITDPGGDAGLPASAALLPDSGPGCASVPGSPRTARPGPAHARKSRRDWRRPLTGYWPLVIILAVQAALSLRLMWSNTAFGDEALYLWAGHLEWAHWLHGASTPDFAAYFSGAPVVYPPLGALADSAGGLAAARAVSLVFMLSATVLLWSTAKRLLGLTASICACALFVVVGPAADVGAFATYDAMAIFLLALAAWLALRAQGRAAEVLLAASVLAMVLADVTKYASALWNPVIIALAVLTGGPGWVRAGSRGLRMLCYGAAVLVPAAFTLGGAPYIRGIMFTTLARQAEDSKVPVAAVWRNSANWTGLLFLLALAGVFAAFKARDDSRWILAVCAAAVLLAPLHQAQIHTLTSLYKHVVFGAWFGAMAAGYALTRLAKVNEAKAWRAGLAALSFACFAGAGQATAMYGFWPNATRVVAVVAHDLPARGLMLAPNGDAHVIDYYLRKRVQDNMLLSPDSAPAATINSMIRDRSFALVVADTPCRSDPGECPVLSALKATHSYRMVSQVPWVDHYGQGEFEVWERGA